MTRISSSAQQTPANTGGTFGNPNDPWALSGSGYSQDNFYTRSTDGNGHSSLVHVKISPALHGELTRLVQGADVPEYRTHADVVRDALIHRLRYIHDQYSGTVSLAALEVEQRQAELDRIAGERESWRKLLGDLERQLDALIDENELDEAEWLIGQNEWIDSMTPPYLVKLARVISAARRRITAIRDRGTL